MKYYEVIKALKETNYQSLDQVMDAIMTYEKFIEYKHCTTQNGNYWFLANLLEETLKEGKFYKALYNNITKGYTIYPKRIQTSIHNFQQWLYLEYKETKSIPMIVRDTKMILRKWLWCLQEIILREIEALEKEIKALEKEEKEV